MFPARLSNKCNERPRNKCCDIILSSCSLAIFERVAGEYPAHVDDWAEIATLAESYRNFLSGDRYRAREAEPLDVRVLAWFDRLESMRGWHEHAIEKVRILTIWAHLAVRCRQPKKASAALALARGFLVTDPTTC